MDGVEAVIRETDDPEVVVTEITHHGWSKAINAPHRHLALGVIRVRDGQIVRYDDYMDPIAVGPPARPHQRTGRRTGQRQHLTEPLGRQGITVVSCGACLGGV
jgi:hypothetical protein